MLFNKQPIIVAMVIGLLFSSCSLMVVPRSQRNVSITTGSKDSEVFVDDLLEGKGNKVTLKKVRKDGIKSVTVRTPMHKDAHFVMVPTKRSPAYWATMPIDVITFPLIYTIYTALMPVTKYFNYEKAYTFKNPHKLPQKADDQKYIRYIATKLKIDDPSKDFADFTVKYTKNLQAEYAKAESKKYELDKKVEKKLEKDKKKHIDEDNKAIDYDDSYFSKDIYENLKKGGYIDTTGKVLVNNSNIMGLEASIVGGKSYKAETKFYGSASVLTVKMDVDWFVKNQYNQIIDSFRISEFSDPFTYSYSKSKECYDKAIFDAVNTSFFALYKNKKFLEHLKISDAASEKQDMLTLTKPGALVKEPKDALKAAAIIKHKDNKGHGSGFAVTNDGYVITNFHVVSGDRANQYKEFDVVMPDGTEVKAEVVRVDPLNDLALLKVDSKFEKAFALSSEKKFDLLEEIYTVGAPASVDLGNTITIGILSSERKGDGVDKIQLNMSVSPGNSGGPIFSKSTGNLYGVLSSKLVGKNTEGVAFAIPGHSISDYLSISYK